MECLLRLSMVNNHFDHMPIDPVKPVSQSELPPMAPPYVDEDVNLALVEEGMDVAENETRDTVADAYEATARLSDDPEETLDDLDYSKDDDSIAPELDAIHEDINGKDENDFEEL
jgi:hypothetical protein